MPDTRINRVCIEGYRSIRNQELELKDVNILIGECGSGKSNLLSALECAGRVLSGNADMIERSAFRACDKSGRMKIELKINGDSCGFTAVLSDDVPVIHEIRRMPDTEQSLNGIRRYCFCGASPDSVPVDGCDESDGDVLRADASNLTAVLLRMQEEHPEDYEDLLQVMTMACPSFGNLILEPADGKVKMFWTERSTDRRMDICMMSDGTFRFLCLAALLVSPKASVLILDDPEAGLHPDVLIILAELIHRASERSQIIIATQSDTLISEFGPEDLIITEADAEGTEFSRVDADRLKVWLDDDYTLGELWKKNLLEKNR